MSSVLAVSAFGLVLLRRPEPIPVSRAVMEVQPVAPEIVIQSVELSAPQESALEPVSETAEESAAEPAEIAVVEEAVETPFVKPVQTLEERGDAMLFEAQALMDTPFDQAITLPFDNL